MKIIKDKRGQSTLEVSFMVIILAAALLAMAVYVKRGMQGRIKQAIDEVADQYSTTNMDSYASVETESTIITDTKIMDEGTLDATSVTTVNTDETITRRGNEQLQEPGKENLF